MIWIVLASVSVATAAAPTERFVQLDVIRWGASTADLQRTLAPLCPKLNTRRIDPPFLPDVKTEQLQIDCDGFRYMGGARWVEFVIRDDRLVMVWLMVDNADAPAIISAMTKAMGKPTAVNERYIAFEVDRTAWRHKPAEILFYAPELDADTRPDFR